MLQVAPCLLSRFWIAFAFGHKIKFLELEPILPPSLRRSWGRDRSRGERLELDQTVMRSQIFCLTVPETSVKKVSGLVLEVRSQIFDVEQSFM